MSTAWTFHFPALTNNDCGLCEFSAGPVTVHQVEGVPCLFVSPETDDCNPDVFRGSLTYNGGTAEWELLAGPDSATLLYTIPGADFDCNEANLFIRVGAAEQFYCGGYPETLTLSPVYDCPPPGSSSGSSAAPDHVTVPCCPNPLSTTFHALLSTSDPGAACLDGVHVPLAYDPGINRWTGATVACGGRTVTLSVECVSAGIWRSVLACGGGTLFIALGTGSCDPLSLGFPSGLHIDSPCYTGGGISSATVGITVTE